MHGKSYCSLILVMVVLENSDGDGGVLRGAALHARQHCVGVDKGLSAARAITDIAASMIF